MKPQQQKKTWIWIPKEFHKFYKSSARIYGERRISDVSHHPFPPSARERDLAPHNPFVRAPVPFAGSGVARKRIVSVRTARARPLLRSPKHPARANGSCCRCCATVCRRRAEPFGKCFLMNVTGRPRQNPVLIKRLRGAPRPGEQ